MTEWKRYGRTPEQRFLEKVAKPNGEDGCWIWVGACASGGYGHFRVARKLLTAHKWAYEHWVGPVPEGMDLDHFVCDNRRCVNPGHVRPASRRENALRGNGAAARCAAKTTCPNGHPYDTVDRRGHRHCSVCRAAKMRAWADTNRERLRAYWREYNRRRRS